MRTSLLRRRRHPGRAALAVAVIAVTLMALVVRSRRLPVLSPSAEHRWVGAYHMHSSDSHDSQVSADAYAEAARAEDLDFLILTDHNNQKAQALTLQGVTVLSFAELSTGFGHVVQLGATYTVEPAQRNDAGVLDAIRAASGVPMLAHPSDAKRPWTGPVARMGGLEVANLSASARRAARPWFFGLLPELLAWPLRDDIALAQLYDRDEEALDLWDSQPDPAVVGLCGVDAHGWIPATLNLRAWHLVLDVPSGSQAPRADVVVEALRQGRFHCVAGLTGRDPLFRFGARRGGDWVASAGDTLAKDAIEQLVVTSPTNALGPSQIVLLRDGGEVTRTAGNSLLYADPQPGTYRVEIRVRMPNLLLGHRWVPVIYSNRLRVLPGAAPAAPP
jgi:hypothetical protein